MEEKKDTLFADLDAAVEAELHCDDSVVVGIRDVVNGVNGLNIYPSILSAFRDFDDLIIQDNTIMHLHPEDFSLMLYGYFDKKIGIFYPLSEAEVLRTGDEVRKES